MVLFVLKASVFFCNVLGFKVPIPHWLTPGKTVVVQTALDNERFRFDLDVEHPLLGIMFEQSGVFREIE